MAYRVIVTGGREYGERWDWRKQERPTWRAEVAHVRRVLDDLADALVPVVIVQGGARGADRRAREWAEHWRQEVVTYEADWLNEGKAAGPRRNRVMVAAGADLVVAFPGGRGTADCLKAAQEAGLTVRDERANGPKEAGR